MDTSHVAPTLTDTQVLDFCKNGYLVLEGVVSAEVNRRTVEFLNEDARNVIENPGEPSEILHEDWFVDGVIMNPAAAGAVRCLLGANFATPVLISNHRMRMPQPSQTWHRDSGSRHGPALHYLQVFYYPEDCPVEMGPTEVLPGSHLLFQYASHMGHYGGVREAVKTAAPAGSIFLTVYSIWHRRSRSTASGIRNLLKYNYWRTSPPQRDWIVEPEFDFGAANYALPRPAMRHRLYEDGARMFFWLCGKSDEFHTMGGQGWPMSAALGHHYIDRSMGYPGEPTGTIY